MTIQIRRDTAANFTASNPILASAEPAMETDTKLRKYGDGVTAWTGLPYSSGYVKPTAGIPKTDLESAVQASLTKADNGIPGPVGMNVRGPWVSTTTYAKYDAVTLSFSTAGTVLFQLTGASGDVGTTPGTASGTTVTPNPPWSVVVTGTAGPAGSGASGVITPSQLGYIGLSYQPLSAPYSTIQLVNGRENFVRFACGAGVPTGLDFLVNSSGAGLTAGQNFVILRRASDGAVIASASADTLFTSGGIVHATFTGVVTQPAQEVIASFLSNGTTPPVLVTGAGDTLLGNFRAAGVPVRTGLFNATGVTSVTSTVDPTAVQMGNRAFLVGITG